MVDAVVEVLIKNLSSLIQQEFGLIWGVEDDINNLSGTLSIIQSVVEDAKTKHITSKALENWLAKLEKTAEEANAVVSKWTNQPQQPRQNRIKQASCTLLSWLTLKRYMFRRKIGKKIKEFMVKFDEIAAERRNFHLDQGYEERVPFDVTKETTSTPPEEVHGLEEDAEKIIVDLLKNSDQDQVSVLPIVAKDSVGKTTLAQLVYNDKRVEKHFDARIWVWVSQEFDIKRMITSIIESLTGEECNITSIDPLQRRLRELLSWKRFLLVLDDVWNGHRDKWNKLKYSLTCGAKGSSIVVTTRVEDAALIMGTLPSHSLQASHSQQAIP